MGVFAGEGDGDGLAAVFAEGAGGGVGDGGGEAGQDVGAVELMLVMPRLIGRGKRMPLPEQLRGFDLAPRHLSLLAFLLLDGPMTVSELAGRLGWRRPR